MENRNLYLLALSLTKGLGPVTVKSLIAYCGSPAEVFSASSGRLLRAPGIGQQAVNLIRSQDHLERAERELIYCQKNGITPVNYLEDSYPHALKYIHDAPLILFKKGPANLNAQIGIGIVGTRKATDYGRHLAGEFAHFFAEQGINVVSGLAYGIDIAAHRAVLKSGGITTAILAHGLDTIYPGQHRSRAQDILQKGALLTEYPTGTKPDAPHFPARNRIISGMCKAVLVVEAAAKGGALITARYAFDQDRQVYALPGKIGDPYSVGCNALIRDQIAKLVTSPQEILDDLEIQWRQHADQHDQLELALQAPGLPLSTEEAKVLNFLGRGDAVIDQITLHTGIPVGKLQALLLGMEFKQLLRQMPGRKFRRI